MTVQVKFLRRKYSSSTYRQHGQQFKMYLKLCECDDFCIIHAVWKLVLNKWMYHSHTDHYLRAFCIVITSISRKKFTHNQMYHKHAHIKRLMEYRWTIYSSTDNDNNEFVHNNFQCYMKSNYKELNLWIMASWNCTIYLLYNVKWLHQYEWNHLSAIGSNFPIRETQSSNPVIRNVSCMFGDHTSHQG